MSRGLNKGFCAVTKEKGMHDERVVLNPVTGDYG